MLEYMKLTVLVVCALLGMIPAYGMEVRPKGNKFFEYVKKGDLEALSAFLGYKRSAKSLDLGVRDGAGWQPLHCAVESGNMQIVRLLIRYGADVNAQIEDNEGERPLHLAARAGNEEIILDLVAAGASPDLADNNGRLPIYYAENILALSVGSSGSSVGSVKNIRAKTADRQIKREMAGRLSITIEEHNQRLLDALLRGDFVTAQLLYEQAGNVNFQDAFGNQLIHHVVNQGSITALEWLLVYGADINARNRDGNRPVRIAALKGHAQIVQWLIKQGASLNDQDEQKPKAKERIDSPSFSDTVLPTVSKETNFEISLRHLKRYYMIHEVLIDAAKQGNIRRAQNALAAGAQIDARDNHGRTPMHHAAREGHIHFIKWLINQGAQVNDRDNIGQEPIHEAAYGGYGVHLEIVQLLVEHGAQIRACDDWKREPIHFAAAKGFLDIIQWLFEHGADICAQDGHKNQAIHWAAHAGQLEVVKSLISGAASKQRQSGTIGAEAGERVMDSNALERERGKIYDEYSDEYHKIYDEYSGEYSITGEYSIKYKGGADINARGEDDRTPLHEAASEGHLKLVEWILYYGGGADLNAEDSEGRTPLHCAASKGHLSIIEFLSKRGADLSKSDSNGLMPIHYAVIGGHLEVAQWISGQPTTRAPGSKTHVERGFRSSCQELMTYAAQGGHLDILRWVSSGAESTDWDDCRHIAASKGHLHIVKWLILMDKGYSDRALHYAAEGGHLAVLKWLAEWKFKLNFNDDLLEIEAAFAGDSVNSSGHNEFSSGAHFGSPCPYLLGGYTTSASRLEAYTFPRPTITDEVNRRDPQGRTPLHFWVKHNDLPGLEWLIEQGANINAQDYDGYGVLHRAAQAGNLEVVQWLVEQGADLTALTNDLLSPVDVAETAGHLSISQWLSEKKKELHFPRSKRLLSKADQQRVNKYLEDALVKRDVKLVQNALGAGANVKNYAFLFDVLRKTLFGLNKEGLGGVSFGETDLGIIKLLIDNGFDINAQDESGVQLIHLAVRGESLEIVQWLIEHGAKLNARDKMGKEPIHYAAESENLEAVQWLVGRGVNSNAQDNNGQTPLHYAAKVGCLLTVQYLVERGADVNAQDRAGNTPLVLASLGQHSKIVQCYKWCKREDGKPKTHLIEPETLL